MLSFAYGFQAFCDFVLFSVAKEFSGCFSLSVLMSYLVLFTDITSLLVHAMPIRHNSQRR
jgi:hypothetical protein